MLSCDSDSNQTYSGVCAQQEIGLIDGNWNCYPNYLEIDCINEEFDNWDYIWIVDKDCEEFCKEIEALDNDFTSCDINDSEP